MLFPHIFSLAAIGEQGYLLSIREVSIMQPIAINEQFTIDVLKSWQHYQETGLHVTDDELVAWLETWGSENESDMPHCHK